MQEADLLINCDMTTQEAISYRSIYLPCGISTESSLARIYCRRGVQFIISHDITCPPLGKYYDSSISISFHIKSSAANDDEGCLDRCTLSYPFLVCAGSSLYSTLQTVLE